MGAEYFNTNITNIEQTMDRKQKQLGSLQKNKLLSKKLSNIEEDLQIESEIRMPSIPKKKMHSHKSEIELGNKLNRIINMSARSNKNSNSVQPHNSSFLSEYKYLNANIRSENLPQLKPLLNQKRNKSSLDKILSDRTIFAKAYFEEISRTERLRKIHPEEEEGIEFQFPEIKVGHWKVRGYLKQNHILLKGSHKDSRICIKKYDYQKVYQKMRRDYQTWVESKFSFEN